MKHGPYNERMPIELLNWLLSPEAVSAAALLIFMAGLSDGIGSQGVTLLINRITPLRFVLGLLASAALFLVSAALWVAALWLSVRTLYGVSVPLALFFVAVSAAYGPLLLGALRLLPLIGTPIWVLLRLWSFGAALASIQAVTGLGFWQAALGALGGTLLLAGASWLLSEPAAAVGGRLWALVTGRPRPLERSAPPLVIPGYEPAIEVEP